MGKGDIEGKVKACLSFHCTRIVPISTRCIDTQGQVYDTQKRNPNYHKNRKFELVSVILNSKRDLLTVTYGLVNSEMMCTIIETIQVDSDRILFAVALSRFAPLSLSHRSTT